MGFENPARRGLDPHWRKQLTINAPTRPVGGPEAIEVATVPTFAALGLSDGVVQALASQQITTPFAIQALVLADALAGRDVLARSRTGSGKTLAFAIPIVEKLSPRRQPSALVLVPTRELATQVCDAFRLVAGPKHLRVSTVYGGAGMAKQVKEANRSDILVATPGRLLDLLRRRLLRLDRVAICVLDEADRMLDMGFLPDVSSILSTLPKAHQTMLFSATLDGEVGRLADRFTVDPVRHEVADARPVVTEALHRFVSVATEGKMELLVRELAVERNLTLVFVRTKHGADRLARALSARGFAAQPLHGNMSQGARERALARFASGDADVLVATDVAARGLDLEHITHVVNFDPPADHTDYVHRVGRTARAGRSGTGLTFVTPDQHGKVARMARHLDLGSEFAAAGAHHGPRPQQPARRAGARRARTHRR